MKEIKEIKLEELTPLQKVGMAACFCMYNFGDGYDYLLDLIRNHACGAVWVSPGKGFEEKIARVKAAADYPLIVVCDSESGAEPNVIPQQIALTAAGAREILYV